MDIKKDFPDEVDFAHMLDPIQYYEYKAEAAEGHTNSEFDAKTIIHHDPQYDVEQGNSLDPWMST